MTLWYPLLRSVFWHLFWHCAHANQLISIQCKEKPVVKKHLVIGHLSNSPLTLSQSKTLPKVENSPCRSSAEHVALRFPTNTLVELGGRARDSSTTRGLPLYSLPSRCRMALQEHNFTLSSSDTQLTTLAVILHTGLPPKEQQKEPNQYPGICMCIYPLFFTWGRFCV